MVWEVGIKSSQERVVFTRVAQESMEIYLLFSVSKVMPNIARMYPLYEPMQSLRISLKDTNTQGYNPGGTSLKPLI